MRGLIIAFVAHLAVVTNAIATPLTPAWTHIGQFGNPGVFETLGASAILAGPRTLARVDLATGMSTLLNNGNFNGQPSFNTAKTKMIIPVFDQNFAPCLTGFDVATGDNVSAFVPAPCNNVEFSFYNGLFIGLCPGSTATSLVGVSAETAVILWSVPLPSALSAPVALDPTTGLLFTSNMNQTVFAIDANTGATKWSRSLASLTASQPTLCGGRIVVPILGSVVAMDCRSGALLWQRATPLAALSSAPMTCGVRPSGETFALLTTDRGHLAMYNAINGSLVFQTNQTVVAGAGRVLALYSPPHDVVVTFGKRVGHSRVVIDITAADGAPQGQFSVQVPGDCGVGMSAVIAPHAARSTLRILFSCTNFFAVDVPLRQF